MRITFLLVMIAILAACGSTGTPRTVSGGHLLIRGVMLVDVRSGSLKGPVSVEIFDGKIRSIQGGAGFTPPADVVRIDGNGLFLMPGLWDMHVHICDESDLAELIVNGVTGVRNMADMPNWTKLLMGFPDPRRLRDQVAAGTLIGPEIITAGPILDGADPISPFNRVIKTPAEARAAVREQLKKGYDLIKVYDNLSPAVFHAILEEAGRLGLPVAGHLPKAVPPTEASGLSSVEHLTPFVDNDRAEFRFPGAELTHYATAARNVWNVPTLVIWDALPPPGGIAELKSIPGFRERPGRVRFLWRQTLKAVYRVEWPPAGYAARMRSLTRTTVQALHAAGTPLIAGTDMNFIGVSPGVSLHRELELLVEAGLSSAEALRTATLNPAVFLGREGKQGEVAAGAEADLLLLRKNPLEDITALETIEEVILDGRLIR